MQQQLLVQLSVSDLKNLIDESVSNAIQKIPQPKHTDEVLLKRKDVAKLFSVSLVTITEWMKTGKLPFHRINSRIFFKRSEVLDALNQKTKSKKHKP
jgi:excisionase family DNA binding protein